MACQLFSNWSKIHQILSVLAVLVSRRIKNGFHIFVQGKKTNRGKETLFLRFLMTLLIQTKNLFHQSNYDAGAPEFKGVYPYHVLEDTEPYQNKGLSTPYVSSVHVLKVYLSENCK